MKCIDIAKMDQTTLQNTLNEIRILCSIESPYIVGYKEAFVERSTKQLCIIMEFVGGGDLSSKIAECYKRKLFINEQTIWKYFCQSLMGLAELHKINIIHRDIKSANIFLSSDF
jgi:NIMA (never in mitosis gene a)-related kinase